MFSLHATIVLNIGRYTGMSAEIPIFYPKRYDKYKILLDIAAWPMWADISPRG